MSIDKISDILNRVESELEEMKAYGREYEEPGARDQPDAADIRALGLSSKHGKSKSKSKRSVRRSMKKKTRRECKKSLKRWM